MADEKDADKKKIKRPTAKKRELQNEKRRLQNKSFKAKVLTAVRAFERSLTVKEAKDMNEKLGEIYSLMDKGVKIGVYKINKANRVKSRLCARVPV